MCGTDETFFGPGSVEKWYGSSSCAQKRKWDSSADNLVQQYKETVIVHSKVSKRKEEPPFTSTCVGVFACSLSNAVFAPRPFGPLDKMHPTCSFAIFERMIANEFRQSLKCQRFFHTLHRRNAAHEVLVSVFCHPNAGDCFF